MTVTLSKSEVATLAAVVRAVKVLMGGEPDKYVRRAEAIVARLERKVASERTKGRKVRK